MAERAIDVIVQIAEGDVADATMTVPDSIFERSRMSLISASRSLPELWIVWQNPPAGSQVALRVLRQLI